MNGLAAIVNDSNSIEALLGTRLNGFGTIEQILLNIVFVVVVFIFAKLAIKFLNKAIVDGITHGKKFDKKGRLDQLTVESTQKIIKYFVYFVAILIILQHIGVEVTALIAMLGIGGIAIAFAAQETIANIISGFVIMLDKPFRIGDKITLETQIGSKSGVTEIEKSGEVIDIGLRSTRIKTAGNVIVTIPNSDFSKREIWNYTLMDKKLKLFIPLSISYESDYKKAKKILIDVSKKHEEALEKEDAVDVQILSFGDSGINLSLSVWIRNADKRFDVRSDLYEKIKEEFDKNGIEIPYPRTHVIIDRENKTP